jgi:transposase
MPGLYLSKEEKARILAYREEGVFIKEIAKRLGRSKSTINKLISEVKDFPTNYIPCHKPIMGRPRKTSRQSDTLLKFEVQKDPYLTSTELKKLHPILLQNVSARTVRHKLLHELGIPSRKAAKKPLLTKPMKLKRVKFAKQYKDWTKEMWNSVMFSDESSFKCIRSTSNRVRRPIGANRYDPKYTVKTVKHPDSVMIWGCYSGNRGRGGLFFLPKKVMMNSERYIGVLKDKLLPSFEMHECQMFMQDGAPCHTSKKVMKWLEDNNIPVLKWPGNSPDLNPIENAWNLMKDKLAEKNTISVPRLIDEIKILWVHMDAEYFKNLSESMPKRLQMVIKSKGEMTKY